MHEHLLKNCKNNKNTTSRSNRQKKEKNSNNDNNNLQKKKTSKETVRSNKFKEYKKLFQKNKKKLSNIIWDNRDLEVIEEFPEISAIEEEYRKIFDSPINDEDVVLTPVNYGEDCSYEPITTDFLKKLIKNLKPTAPGSDFITIDHVRSLDIKLLSIFYNLILAKGAIPDSLRKCRTTLIPKGGNSKDIKNWRPITITSILLRILNKIIAARLNKLKLHNTQKGFRNIDGCLANILLIQNVIKHYRTRARPYNIVTVDLKKAFDTVQHNTINNALQRIGVDERIRKLIDNQYIGTSTIITCGKERTGEIPIKRGVKQGDALSPFIFNCIIVMNTVLISMVLRFPPLLTLMISFC